MSLEKNYIENLDQLSSNPIPILTHSVSLQDEGVVSGQSINALSGSPETVRYSHFDNYFKDLENFPKIMMRVRVAVNSADTVTTTVLAKKNVTELHSFNLLGDGSYQIIDSSWVDVSTDIVTYTGDPIRLQAYVDDDSGALPEVRWFSITIGLQLN